MSTIEKFEIKFDEMTKLQTMADLFDALEIPVPKFCQIREHCYGVAQTFCRRCKRWGCDDCFDGPTNLCYHDLPLEEEAYQEAIDEFRSLGTRVQFEFAGGKPSAEDFAAGADHRDERGDCGATNRF